MVGYRSKYTFIHNLSFFDIDIEYLLSKKGGFFVWENIEERVLRCGEHIVKTGCTVRACAECFGTSKSTVHTVVIK